MDGIELEIVWSNLISIVSEQAKALQRIAFSPIVREAGDLANALFDRQGRMVAQAVTGTPGHVNAMAASVKHFIEKFPLAEMQDGDVFLTNDPWKATGHLFDMTMVTPVFYRKTLVALFASTSHVIDIGGIGSSPDGLEIYHEGLFLPILRFIDKGTAWAHLDIAGVAWQDGEQKPMIPSWGTGWGVRLLNRLVIEHYDS